MVGLNPSTGERLEKSIMSGDVNTQIDADRLVQPVVCRDQTRQHEQDPERDS